MWNAKPEYTWRDLLAVSRRVRSSTTEKQYKVWKKQFIHLIRSGKWAALETSHTNWMLPTYSKFRG